MAQNCKNKIEHGEIRMNFVAIDLETANHHMASICQIGLARYRNSKLVDEYCKLINPEDTFNDINVSIHGINKNDVIDQPILPQIINEVLEFISDDVCVCHAHYDKKSISYALQKYKLPQLTNQWLDSSFVARRTWEECSKKGYGLANICNIIGYEFNHHHALEDAKAAGEIILAASKIQNLDIDGWLKLLSQPRANTKITKDGNEEGVLYGEILVFTGTLSMNRENAANFAASLGCKVDSGVTRKTTLLVVGEDGLNTSKYIKVQEYIRKGISIRILNERDFYNLI